MEDLSQENNPLQENGKQTQSFPFFHLPDLVICKILKKYVPITDKMNTLFEMPEFKTWLTPECMWFPSTKTLFQLVQPIPPGWYIDYKNLHNRYHFSVDYDSLNVTIQSFCTKFEGFKKIRQTEKVYRPFPKVELAIQKFQELQLTPVEEKDVLVYKYTVIHHCQMLYLPQNVYIWIFRSEGIVRVSYLFLEIKLKENKCYLHLLHAHAVLLTFQEDLSITLQCMMCGNMGCENCGEEREIIRLTPLMFRTCDKTSECTPCQEDTTSIHAVSILTFTGFDKKNILVLNRQFIPMRALAMNNIISTYCLDFKMNEMQYRWIKVYSKVTQHHYKLPL